MRVWGPSIYVLTYAVGWLWPAFRSFEALESKSTIDDSQWLTYWVLLAIFSMLEAMAWNLLKYIPMYPELKLVLLAWLTMPPFNGASWIYFQCRPHLIKGTTAVRSQIASSGLERPALTGDPVSDLRVSINAYESHVKSTLASDYAAVISGKTDATLVLKKVTKLEMALFPEVSPEEPETCDDPLAA